ncbi:hypothetical protein GF406_03140 [candidate division KSB1 bacterium]|nr:hypothetical protein [candidate division KSB1 bacterium]
MHFNQKYSMILIAAAILIVLLSWGMHAPPHMQDILTGEIDTSVEIIIHPVRIVFEPLIGFLLFLVRGIRPLQEFLMLILWIFVIDLVIILRSRGTSLISRSLGRWGGRIALHLAVWSGILLIMLFGHLPANSVTNLSDDQALVNIHSHTDYSHDGLVSHKGLHAWHERNGFDAYFLTEHNHHTSTLQWVEKQTQNEISGHPVVLAGQEYSGSNHILLLGLTRAFNTKDMPDSVAIDSAHVQNGIAIVAHWFSHKRHPLIKYIRDGADGFEIANQAEGLSVDSIDRQTIIDHATAHELLLLASCDYHGYGPSAYAYVAFEIAGWDDLSVPEKRASIMDILRRREQERIRPLIYVDRPVYSSSLLWASPFINLFYYFRHLSLLQTLAWLIWLPILGWLFMHIREKRFLHIAAIIASASVLYFGTRFLLLSRHAFMENDIYAEYGIHLAIIGVVFLLYAVIYTMMTRARV